MEDLRKSARYAVDKAYSGRVQVELHGGGRLRGEVLDLSVTGLSFEIKIDTGSAPDGVAEGEEFYITLYINEINILAGVEKIWSIIKESGYGKIYRAGLRFKMLAAEDRLKLNSSIEHIRESIQTAARNRNQT